MADPPVAAETCVALGATEHQFESFPGRDIALGALTVTRVLPVKGRRLVGPWCFLDRFGPLTFADPSPMDVGAHPHMGMQTVTWLLDGELVHYDSLGYESLLRAGGVNVMTSGAAIAHAERTPAKNSGRLSGVIQPTASFKDTAGRVCRHIVLVLTTGVRSGRVEGVACRLTDGRWQLEG